MRQKPDGPELQLRWTRRNMRRTYSNYSTQAYFETQSTEYETLSRSLRKNHRAGISFQGMDRQQMSSPKKSQNYADHDAKMSHKGKHD